MKTFPSLRPMFLGILCAGAVALTPAALATTDAADELRAAETVFGGAAALELPASCQGLELSAEQRQRAQRALRAAAGQARELGQQLKENEERYGALVATSGATREAARRLDGRSAQLAQQLAATATGLRTTLLFGVATAEQRPTAAECLKDVVKQMARERLERLCERLPGGDEAGSR